MRALAALALLIAACPALAAEPAPPHVRVTVEFRQAARATRDAVQGRGRVIVTERGARGGGGVGVESTTRQTRTSSALFTIVRSGGEASLAFTREVPQAEVVFYRDYLTGQGYLASGVVFRELGTSVKLTASVLPDRRIAVRLTPVLSYLTPDGSGTVEVTRAATDVVVRSGEAVVIGGATTETGELVRRILGYVDTTGARETLIVLTATIQ